MAMNFQEIVAFAMDLQQPIRYVNFAIYTYVYCVAIIIK